MGNQYCAISPCHCYNVPAWNKRYAVIIKPFVIIDDRPGALARTDASRRCRAIIFDDITIIPMRYKTRLMRYWVRWYRYRRFREYYHAKARATVIGHATPPHYNTLLVNSLTAHFVPFATSGHFVRTWEFPPLFNIHRYILPISAARDARRIIYTGTTTLISLRKCLMNIDS